MSFLSRPVRYLIIPALIGAALAIGPGALSTSAAGTVNVGCNATSLANAITAANGASGQTTLQLASRCTYTITTPATVTTGLPTVTGNIVLVGTFSTTIQRAESDSTHFRLLDIAAGGKLTLQGLVLQNGRAGNGGAIQNAGSLNANSVTFRNNTADNGGAIVNLPGSTANLFSSRFDANGTFVIGGGAILNFSQVTSRASTFTDNTAPVNGGAINTQPGAVTTILGGLFTGNTAGTLGGALSNLGTLNVTGAAIYGNTGSSGGGIASGNNLVSIVGSIIFYNNPDNCEPSDLCTSPYSFGGPISPFAVSCPIVISGDEVKSFSKSC